MAKQSTKKSEVPVDLVQELQSPRKHEYLAFRKIVLLAGERMGRETNRMSRDRSHYENMHGVAEATGINRTSISYIKEHPDDGGTQTPSIETFQRMAEWLRSLNPPLQDKDKIPIQYSYLELIDLNEKAKAVGDPGDLVLIKPKVKPSVVVDPSPEIIEEEVSDEDQATAELIATIIAKALAELKAQKKKG